VAPPGRVSCQAIRPAATTTTSTTTWNGEIADARDRRPTAPPRVLVSIIDGDVSVGVVIGLSVARAVRDADQAPVPAPPAPPRNPPKPLVQPLAPAVEMVID
jgi:hypothetical protein